MLQYAYLYDEGTASTLDAAAVAAYLEAMFGLGVEVRGAFLLHHLAGRPEAERERELAALAERLARVKVREVERPDHFPDPLPGEVDFERRRLGNDDRGAPGILYDGFRCQQLLAGRLPPGERSLEHLHLVFTNRTLGTWEESDRRYHLRSILLGHPAIISTTGLVEAPAKPREFYFARQRLGLVARDEAVHAALKEQFRGRFHDHDDPRLTEVAKGYALQAAFYQAAGVAFCANPDCRLYNAHWQEELLRAQLGPKANLCPEHAGLLEKAIRDRGSGVRGQGKGKR